MTKIIRKKKKKHKTQKTILALFKTTPGFHSPTEESFSKNCGKGENAGSQHVLLFPQCFLAYLRQKSSFKQYLSSANAFNFVKAKILPFGKELILFWLTVPNKA